MRNNHYNRVYIPYIGDHSYVIAAAMRASGVDAVSLPPSDDETMALGLEYCRGSECSPCFTTIGDCVRLTQHPDFDPARSVIFLPTTTGPCRYGQYVELLRDVMDRLGCHDLHIAAPSTSHPFEGFGNQPVRIGRLMWQGIVAVDLIYKLLFEYRPYERHQGQTDQMYAACLERIVVAIEKGAENHLVHAMNIIAEQFEQLPIDEHTNRPRIGLLGEIYLRFNPCTNLDIIRLVEDSGGEVVMSSMTEWVYHMVWDYMRIIWGQDNLVEWFALSVTDLYQQHEERRFIRPVAHLLRHPYETPIGEVIEHVRGLYMPEAADDTVLNIGKTIDFADQGVSGIINLMPFSCMPGIITAGMAPRLRDETDRLPWLDLVFDTQGTTGLHTRLEAFMHQASEYQRSRQR
jgi:predicted nucleotide-binding protein (sugar kinase/HSP70/actin superfamily)